jgi:hypothetical protein
MENLEKMKSIYKKSLDYYICVFRSVMEMVIVETLILSEIYSTFLVNGKHNGVDCLFPYISFFMRVHLDAFRATFFHQRCA